MMTITVKSVRDVLRIAYIFKWRALISFIFIIGLIITLLFVLRPEYRSQSKVLITLGRTNAALPIDVQGQQTAISSNYQRDYLLDESKLLSSDLVINQVVDRWLGVLTAPKVPTTWFGRVKSFIRVRFTDIGDWFRDRLIQLGLLDRRNARTRVRSMLTRGFRVDHEPGAAVLDVSLTLRDPRTAQEVLASWINIYLSERFQTPNGAQLRTFYSDQVEATRREIDGLEAKRAAIEHQLGTLDLPRRELAVNTRIDALLTKRAETSAELDGIAAGLSASTQALANIPGYVPAEYKIGQSPTTRDLEARLNGLLLDRQSQLHRFAAGSKPIVQLDKSIGQVRGWIQQGRKAVDIDETKKINPLAEQINSNIVIDKISEAKLRAKDQSLLQDQTVLEQQRDAILAARNSVDDLERRLKVATANYSLYAQSLAKASVNVALDRQRIGSARVIQPASFQPSRVFPRTVLLLEVSPGLGIGFALFIIYISALTDRRIHDGGNFERRFNLPLLATVPEIRDERSPRALATRTLARVELARLVLRLRELCAGNTAPVIALTATQRGEGVSFVYGLLGEVSEVPAAAGQPEVGAIKFAEAPPIGSAEQSLPILAACDGIVLVIEAGVTTVPVVEAAVAALHSAFGPKLLGIVLNRRRHPIPNWLY